MYANYRTIYKECRRERIVDSFWVWTLCQIFFFIHSCTRQNKFRLDSQTCVSSARNEFYSLLFMVNKFHEKANVYF